MCSWRKGGWAAWAGQGNRENDHPDACQGKKAVEIRHSMMSVWKKRPSVCLGSCDELQHEKRAENQELVPLLSMLPPRLPSMWRLGGGGGEELSPSPWLAQTQPKPGMLSWAEH